MLWPWAAAIPTRRRWFDPTRSPMTLGSLFSGIGGIDLGFHRAGFEIAWQVEIDRQASSVLARHWPDVPRFEDVRKVGKKQLSPVDVIAFGSPCQDFSVAGKRGGIAGERSGLIWEALRIVRQLRPAFALWENVPGALSSNSGRDFAAILSGFRKLGARDIAWRTFDARYFNVAQRRERAFLVADFRGERAGEILFEPACVCGNTPPRSKAGESVAGATGGRSSIRGGEDDSNIVAFNPQAGGSKARIGGTDAVVSAMGCTQIPAIAPTIPARSKAGGGIGTDFDCDGGLIVGSVTSKWAKGSGGSAGDECYNLVAHTLRGEGADASEDGTGRGTPLVCQTLNASDGGASSGEHPLVCGTLGANHGNIKAEHAWTGQLQAGSIGVRRLTPRECERLMNLPDDWTRYDASGKELRDGPRYKMIGNGVVVSVIEWIARRIKGTA